MKISSTLLMLLCTLIMWQDIGCCEEGGATSYMLSKDEHLFVQGVKYSDLVFSKSSDGLEFFINGTLVYKYYPPTNPNEYIEWPSNLSSSEPILRWKAEGISTEAAVQKYKEKILEFSDLHNKVLLQVTKGELEKTQGMDLLDEWLVCPENVGLIKEVNLRKGDSSWKQAVGGPEVSVSYMVGYVSQAKDYDNFIQEHINYFQDLEGSQIMIVSSSSGIYRTRGKNVNKILFQLDEAKSTGAYVDGPMSPDFLTKYGFIGGN